MIIFPAIDILDNRAVRLLYGKRDQVTDYGSPLERAEMWQDAGAEYLHIVDLNGAFDDSRENSKILKELINKTKIPIQLGGGIKSLDKVKFYLEEIGVTRVIMGTVCVTDSNIIEQACAKFGNKIVGGIDAKDNKVLIKGWVEASNYDPLSLALKLKNMAIDTIVYTDISRDGAMTGVNLIACKDLAEKSNMNIIASGGMASIKDIENIKNANLYGAILGRSIYEGAIDLKQAINLSKEKKC